MPIPGFEAFDHSIQLTNLWLQEIQDDLGGTRSDAWHALRAVLGALRDRLPVEEVAHLSAQLPLLVRGIYFDGWRPGSHQRIKTRGEFLERVSRNLLGVSPISAEDACDAVLRLLHRRVSSGEMADIRAVLPADLKPLIEPA